MLENYIGVVVHSSFVCLCLLSSEHTNLSRHDGLCEEEVTVFGGAYRD